MSRTTRITVTVTGEPVRKDLDFEVKLYPSGTRTYRATFVSRDYYYGEGNWTPQRWGGVGTIVKKDGTLGIATTLYLPWDWEPDAETQKQFADTARMHLARASGYRASIA